MDEESNIFYKVCLWITKKFEQLIKLSEELQKEGWSNK